jgi:hypothetical protein
MNKEVRDTYRRFLAGFKYKQVNGRLYVKPYWPGDWSDDIAIKYFGPKLIAYYVCQKEWTK